MYLVCYNLYMKKKEDDNRLIQLLSSLEVKAMLKTKRLSDNKFRVINRDIAIARKGSDCVICGENRATEYAHIIPVSYLKRIGKEYQEIANIPDNGLFLCKNHHWCFDHLSLTKLELEKIYLHREDFINNILLQFANMEHKENPNAKISAVDRLVLKQFNNWLRWVSEVFFVKNT